MALSGVIRIRVVHNMVMSSQQRRARHVRRRDDSATGLGRQFHAADESIRGRTVRRREDNAASPEHQFQAADGRILGRLDKVPLWEITQRYAELLA